jgi:hypothetical protein
MEQPRSLAEIVDTAMVGILGPDGFERYATLCWETAETRRRIEREVRGEFRRYYDDVLAELAGMWAATAAESNEANWRAGRRLQEELGQRMADEEQAFKLRCEALFNWVQGRQACEGCG